MKRFLLFCCISFASFAAMAALIHGKNSSNGDEVYRSTSGQMTITELAGEDATADVIKVEHQYSYCAGIVADGSCKASAGFLHTVTCAGDDAAATAGSLAIRDATSAGSGTIIQNVNFAAAYFAPVTMTFDVIFSTGLYLDFTTTGDVECSASYR